MWQPGKDGGMGTFEDLVDMIAYCAKNPFIFPSLPGSGKIKVNLGSAKKAETNHKKVVAQEAKDAKKAAAEASKVRQLRHHFGTITYASSHRPHTSLWDSVLGDIRAVCHDLLRAHAIPVLTGACTPMLCPLHASRSRQKPRSQRPRPRCS